jgi:hypothetical protein
MKVLVDYDNIPLSLRNPGVLYLADRISTQILRAVPSCASFDFRLYGGWNENWSSTRRAQVLNAELGTSFPRIIKSAHIDPPVSIRWHAVLAQSLESLPRKLLENTLRTVPFEKHLQCQSAATIGCATPQCPLDHMASFLNAGTCPKPGCNKIPSMVLKSTEQKLVDTMIVADLLHLTNQGEKAVAVVSSDDDMWPGIIQAMQTKAHVLHLQTRGAKQSLPYRKNVPGNYTSLEL